MTNEQKSEIASLAQGMLIHSECGPYIHLLETVWGRDLTSRFYIPFFCKPLMNTKDFEVYCKEILGMSTKSASFTFLFSEEWPNDKNQFAARVYCYLTEGLPTHRDFYLSWVEREPEEFNQWIL